MEILLPALKFCGIEIATVKDNHVMLQSKI